MSDKPFKKGRWLKPAKKTYAPAVLVTVIVESWHDAPQLSTGHRIHTMRKVHVAESHHRGRHWSEPLYRCFAEAEEFWEWLETKVTKFRRIHVLTPNVSETVRLLGWWARIEERGATHETGATAKQFKRRRRKRRPATLERPGVDGDDGPEPEDRTYYVKDMYEGGRATVFRYRVNGRSYLWANFGQYITCTEELIASALNYAWFVTPALGDELPNQQRTPTERVLMWLRFFQGLAKWWVRNKGGPWGATVAACAMSYLKIRLKPRTVLQHEHPVAMALEERAIFAGRRSVWYVGNIGTEADWKQHGEGHPTRSPWGTLPGPMVHHDIRSMYPWLLCNRDFPVRLLTVRRAPSIASVKETLAGYGVIATVTIHTTIAEYPLKTERGIRFPIGKFITTLAGPELSRAIEEGIVQEVHTAAVYLLGRPFEDTCTAMLEMREKFRNDGEHAYELFAKSLANAMSGKIAQRQFAWAARPEMAVAEQWGMFKRLNADTKTWTTYKARAGLVWERVPAEDRARQMGAAYAYLTSYGRVMMRDLRAACPPRSVLAQDTDGIWTLASAMEALYGTRDTNSGQSGALRVTISTPVGRFFGAQHYWWGRAWVLSGHSTPIVRPGTNVAEVRIVSTGGFTPDGPPPAHVYEKRIERDIGRIQDAGPIDGDGWVRPKWVHPDSLVNRPEDVQAEVQSWWN